MVKRIFKVVAIYDKVIGMDEDEDNIVEEIEYDELSEDQKKRVEDTLKCRLEGFESYIKMEKEKENVYDDGAFRNAMKKSWNARIEPPYIIFKVDDEEGIEEAFDVEISCGIFCNDGIDVEENDQGEEFYISLDNGTYETTDMFLTCSQCHKLCTRSQKCDCTNN